MAGELMNDGKYIYINCPYAEMYIPEEIIDTPTGDPKPSRPQPSRRCQSLPISHIDCPAVFLCSFPWQLPIPQLRPAPDGERVPNSISFPS